MREADLRTVLLVHALDEADGTGEVLPLAERSEATRSAAQDAPQLPHGTRLSGPAERVLVRRAELLLGKLSTRAPVLSRMLELLGGSSLIGPLVLALAFAFGAAVSALDGSGRIQLLAFPMLGLIAWNLLVYVTLIGARLASLRKRKQLPGGKPISERLPGLYARWLQRRTEGLLAESERFNAPLAQVLRRFSRDWASVSRPLLALRAERLFHLGAAVLSLGVICGLYVRGLLLRYAAGWDSTFLDAEQVHAFMRVLYGPASYLTGIPLPTVAELATLRWSSGGAGAPAGPFIHLIAVTALLYIVLPRLLAVLATTVALFGRTRRLPLPAEYAGYARKILLETGKVSALSAHVVSYAYEPSSDALSGLSSLLTDALGGEVKLNMRGSIPYGEEDTLQERVLRTQPSAADCHVLLMSASATPETENHGSLIRSLQSRVSHLLVVVDESPYALRLGTDPAYAARRTERARTWREFVTQHGAKPCVVELRRLAPGSGSRAEAAESVRRALTVSA